jgi:hypothetical protein
MLEDLISESDVPFGVIEDSARREHLENCRPPDSIPIVRSSSPRVALSTSTMRLMMRDFSFELHDGQVLCTTQWSEYGKRSGWIRQAHVAAAA